MTCIVGIASQGRVFIGGDSAGVGGYDLTVRNDRKVFRNGDFVMGFTTSFRMGQLLAFAFNPPKPREGTDVFAYMVTDFVDAARATMKTGGFSRVKDTNSEQGGVFLVGYAGRLFKIESDFQVGESIYGFDAAGCGDQLALGSLHTSSKATGLFTATDPEERIREALRVAESCSAGVRQPFFIESTPAKVSA
jgi:hypothetical protein